MKRRMTLSLLLVLALGSLSLATVAADGHEAMVYVGHGIPGQALGFDDNELPVDVLVNDEICLLEGFEFGEFAGPVELPEGTYNIKISLADVDDPCSGEPEIEANVEFEAGVNYTVFAHLTAEGAPTASLFTNDVTPAVPGTTRLTVRHTAAAPAVDIKLYRGWERGRMVGLIPGLVNPNQAGPLNIRPGAYEAVILAADTDDIVFALPVELEPHLSYLVYAVGGLDTETFTVLVQVIPLGITLPPRPVPPVPGPPFPVPPIPVPPFP